MPFAWVCGQMSDKKDLLVGLVVDENVSALQTMQDELELSEEEVTDLLRELLKEGRINGKISDDGKRFWKSDAKVSSAPAIPHGDDVPAFMKYDTRPGMGLSIAGCTIDIIAFVLMTYATSTVHSDAGAILFFVGLIVLLIGLYWISLRKTPD